MEYQVHNPSTNISGNFCLKLNEMVLFGSVLWKYLGSPVKVVLFGLEDWPRLFKRWIAQSTG